jgi:hypothetical protein
MTPNEVMQQLVAASRALAAVLDEESAALAAVRFGRVAELREAKESAAEQYETALRTAGSQPQALAASSPADRRALAVAKVDLDQAAARNINALRAAMEMNRRLVQTVAASIERQRISASGYTKTGAAYNRTQAPTNGDALPVSLNRTF